MKTPPLLRPALTLTLFLLCLGRLPAASLVTQQAYLKASNTGTFDLFGLSAAISGDTLVIGANNEASNASGVNGDQADNSATGAGAAYVFVRQGGTWVQQAYLKASNTDSNDNFAYSVAISGDTIVVGAYQEDSSARGINGDQSDNYGTNAGAVYVFERTGNQWVQQAYLKMANTEFGERFGRSVAISGDTIVAGAYVESGGSPGVNGDPFNNDAPGSGAAYVFVRSGTNWSQQAYLKASNPGLDDLFGWSVAISGDTIAVGAAGEDGGAAGVNANQTDNSKPDAGAVYVFVRSGTNWTQQAYVKASNPGSTNRFGFLYGDQFGFSVSLAGNTLVVGARNEASNAAGVNGNQGDDSVLGAGAAYVFTRNNATWSQQAYLKASYPRNSAYFGWSVSALTEDRLLVGADQEWSNATGIDGDPTNFNATASGAAYLFTRTGSTWSQAAYIKASITEASDNFGWSVAGSGDTLVVGAPHEDSSATGINGNQADNSLSSAGAAYVFTAVTPGPPVILDQPLSRTNNASTKATFAVTATGTPPLAYQWRWNGFQLTDGGNVLGAQSPLLSLSPVLHIDEGTLEVIVSNASGSATSRVARLTVRDPVLLRQSPTPMPSLGESFDLSIEVVGTLPLSYQWRHNGTLVPGLQGPVLTVAQAQLSDAGDYQVTAANAHGSVTASFTVAVNGVLVDPTFQPELWIEHPGETPLAFGLAVQPDGRIVVAGYFDAVNGQPTPSLARLQPDGQLDPTLVSGFSGPPNALGALLLQPREWMLASGPFASSPFLARYLPTGAMEPIDQFGPLTGLMVRQLSGAVLLPQFVGPGLSTFYRLTPAGALDENYHLDVSQDLSALAVQRDGKVLLAGALDELYQDNVPYPVSGLARLNADGTVDAAFAPQVREEGGGWRGWVELIAVQEDGKILITGYFGEVNGVRCPGMARLHPDGSVDTNFNASLSPPGFALVRSMVIQADGKIILGGNFGEVNGQPIRWLARLHPDGSLDTSFRPAVDGPVECLTLQPDGRVLVGGPFFTLGGQPRTGLGRLLNTGPATESLGYDGTTVGWVRGGTAPAVWRTEFERSADGTNWIWLGAGTRVGVAWELNGVSVPVGHRVRARGWVAGGANNASSWVVESEWTVPMRLLPPSNPGAGFGFTVVGPAGGTVVIESSPDLQTWTPVRTNLLGPQGLFEFMEAGSPAAPRRFYRSRLP